MAEIAPKPERVRIWMPADINGLLGSNLPEYDPNKGIIPPNFENFVERFDTMKEGALTQHAGRVANRGQDIVLWKLYDPLLGDGAPEDAGVQPVASIEVKAQWKGAIDDHKAITLGISRNDHTPEQKLTSMMYIMSELEDALVEGRAFFMGRV
jgi:uncharacterized protein YegL